MRPAFAKRYRFPLFMLAAAVLVTVFDRFRGIEAGRVMIFCSKEMILVIPPIFILLGLLDVWVPRETLVRFMGRGSGLKGGLLALALGSAGAGPMYGAFPVAAVFLRKGASMVNVLIFIGAWSTTKIPMFLFELANFGVRFALARLASGIPGIVLIALLLDRTLGRLEKETICRTGAGL